MKKLLCVAYSVLLAASLLFSDEVITRTNGTKIVLYDNFTWAPVIEQNGNDVVSAYRKHLRQGISASDEQLKIACEMYAQGWRYSMPNPKSKQASWGNSDGRTTWYNGYWHNETTDAYSVKTPLKTSGGTYAGDNQNQSGTWSNGGSPQKPDVYMYLLSPSGGPAF